MNNSHENLPVSAQSVLMFTGALIIRSLHKFRDLRQALVLNDVYNLIIIYSLVKMNFNDVPLSKL